MKKLFYLILLPLVFISCNQGDKKCDDCQTFTGDFLYFEGAAVLKGSNFIYAVELNDQAKKLSDQIEGIKIEAYDMVEVTVKGIVNPKPENKEGWDEILSIKEIITIANEPSEADILIQH